MADNAVIPVILGHDVGRVAYQRLHDHEHRPGLLHAVQRGAGDERATELLHDVQRGANTSVPPTT